MTEPAITIQAYHVSSGDNRPVIRVVIHTTEPGQVTDASKPGMARATANYFTGSGSGGSAHYVCDAAGEEHCVADKAIAWHAPPNPHSIGIEICGRAAYTRDQWLTGNAHAALVRAAARAAELCDRFAIPKHRLSVADVGAQRPGICGHVDVSRAFHQTDHTDPGPAFPWDVFMQLVTNGSEDDVTDADKADIVKQVVEALTPIIKQTVGDAANNINTHIGWVGPDGYKHP